MKLNAGAVGAAVAAVAMGGLGLVELAGGEALPGLHPYPDDWSPFVRPSGAFLVLFAATAWRARLMAIGLALCWLAASGFVAIALTANARDPLAWAPLAQTLVFAAFALWLWGKPRTWPHALLRIAFGATLVFFGCIHLTHAGTIGGLIPDFIPGASLWPWITGGVQVIAGLACIAGRGVLPAGATIAAMYAAWLPIVHAPRLFASPASPFEWTFALTALALAGIALAVAKTSES
jgi:hypothetical protein